jgi:hypothetical protein
MNSHSHLSAALRSGLNHIQPSSARVFRGVHERAAWSYEDPLPRMQRVAGRFGFWQDIEVG